jgi:hypothetical protein
MADFTKILNNFTGGKVSDRFKGRFDLQFYQNSLEELKNFYIGKIGGIFKRTGTVAVCDVTNHSASIADKYQSIPFDAGNGTSYVFMFPNKPLKAGVSGFNLGEVFIYENDDTLLGSETIVSGQYVTSTPLDWTPQVASFSDGMWKYCQVGDLLFLTHSSGYQRPLTVARLKDVSLGEVFIFDYYDSFNITNPPVGASETLRQPYNKPNISSLTMSITGTTLTASVAIFEDTMEGSYMRIGSGTEDVVRLVTYLTSTTFTISYVIGSAPTASTDDWRLSSWSNYYGYPTSVTYFQQRLFWGGTAFKQYETVWGSLVGNLFHMMVDRLDQDSSSDVSGVNYFGDSTPADPVSFIPASQEANAVKWLAGTRRLMIGTANGEFIANGFDGSIDIIENSNYGSENAQIVKAGKDLIYIGKNRRSLRTYRYSEENGSWLSDDLSSKAEDMFLDDDESTSTYIRQTAWNASDKLLWVLMSDGKLFGFNYDPEYGLKGWFKYEIADSTAEVISLCVLPSVDRTRNQTIFLVKRNMAGAGGDVYYLEKDFGEYTQSSLHPTLSTEDILRYPRFVDFGNIATADSSGEIDGQPADFVGEFFDCVYFTDSEVGYQLNVEMIDNTSNPKLDYTFPTNARVIYGYEYSAEMKMLPMDSGGVLGSAISDLKDISRLYVKLYKSMGFKIGSKDQRSGLDLSFETVSYDDLVTKEKEIFLFDNPDSEEQAIIRSNGPYPLNILAMIIKGDSKR